MVYSKDMKSLFSRSFVLFFLVLSFSQAGIAEEGADDPLAKLNAEVKRLYDEGKYAEAVKPAEEALAKAEELLGPDDPEVGLAAGNLAKIYQSIGDADKAEGFFLKALAVDEKAFGENSPAVMVDTENLVVFYYLENKYDEAEEFSLRSIELKEKMFGQNSVELASSLYMYANIRALQNDTRSAEEVYERLLTIMEDRMGPDHPDVVRLVNETAELYAAGGNYSKAAQYYENAIRITEKEEGKGKVYPPLSDMFDGLIALCREMKDDASWNTAEGLLKERLLRDPKDAVVLTWLGEIYWDKEKRRDAIDLFRRAIKIKPDYPPPYYFIGKAYIFEKKKDKALKYFDIFERKMGSFISAADNRTLRDFYVTALYYMAYVNSTLKRTDEVVKYYTKIIEIYPDEQRAHYNLAVCYYKYLNKPRDAYSELQKVVEIDADRSLSDKAELFMDYMRRNPDPRYSEDISFIEEK